MAIIKCKMCGGSLEVTPGTTVAECEFCGTKQTLPKVNDEVIQNLFNRANNLRLKCEFDKAMQIYEKIVEQDDSEAEAHWGIVLCKYGIEYVEDPKTFKRIPTCHRTLFEAVTTDTDYLAAVDYSDAAQQSIYESEARAIDRIQKDILAIVKNEKPFDVFICYKETDENGKRTVDSAIANDIYYQLTQEGLKVFYAAITLEDKLGQEYEPYIFAALNSAKVMLVIGTKPQYFTAVWVKNEWSRFLKLMKSDRSKLLIPCYRDMDAYDLPEEFAHLQAQDMSKIGFINDVVRGIKKLTVNTASAVPVVKETVVNNTGNNVAPLLKRAFIFLEDGDWKNADEYCEKVLDIDPECAEAYLGKLMVSIKVMKRSELATLSAPFVANNQYVKLMRYASSELKTEIEGYLDIIYGETKRKQEESYRRYTLLATSFNKFYNQLEYDNQKQQTKTRLDSISVEESKLRRLASTFLPDCREYEAAETAISGKQKRILMLRKDRESLGLLAGKRKKEIDRELSVLEEDVTALKRKSAKHKGAMGGYTNLDDIHNRINVLAKEKSTVAEELDRIHSALKELETVTAQIGSYTDVVNELLSEKNRQFLFEDIGTLSKLYRRLNRKERYALKPHIANRAIAYAREDRKENAFSLWEIISARKTISAQARHTVGLKTDGTIIARGGNDYGQCNVSNWDDVIAVSAGATHTVGLKADGTVLACGLNGNGTGQCNVRDWTDIIAISAGGFCTLGLKTDGTVVATGGIGPDFHSLPDLSGWTDIVDVSGAMFHIVGLKSDGTVVAVGDNSNGQCNVANWSNIVAVVAGQDFTAGLKSDGTVIGTALFARAADYCVDGWRDIIAIDSQVAHLVGLKSNGTVVATGSSDHGECRVSGWNNIVDISAGFMYTIGLRANGTVVSIGGNEYGQCNIGDWTDIKVPEKN